MEQRRLVLAMVVAMGLVILWQIAFPYIGRRLGYNMDPPPPPPPATTQPATSGATTDSTPVGPGTTPSIGASSAPVRIAASTQPANAVELGSSAANDPTYRMLVRLRPEGAAIDSVVLNEFKQSSGSEARYTYQTPYEKLESSRSMATRTVSVNGTKIDLTSAAWELESSGPDQATFGITLLGSDGAPLVRVHKSYQLTPRSDVSAGYELNLRYSFDNLSAQPVKVATSFNGPTTPPMESKQGADRQTLVGFAGKGFINVTHDMMESFTEKAPTRDYTKDKEGNKVIWSGTSSIYFNALVHPIPLTDPNQPAEYVEKITATALNPTHALHQIEMTFDVAEQTVAPGQSLALPMRVFFGPRQRSLLNGTYYSSFPLSYNSTLVLTSGPCGVCTFQWLIDMLVRLLAFFHILTRDWGLSIILLVILVRALLHPITKRSQISMSKMSKMGPEMERLKKKYEGQPDELNKAMMQFYKTQGATPILGCLPMFLQMPIWIALWQSLQTTFELRQAPFLRFFGHNLTWIHDLSKPDHLIEFSQTFDFFFLHISGLNILPLLLAVVFYLQQKMQPQPAAMTPEQQQQQKMMKWMTVVLFPLMFYSGPSGLNLYILTSTFIGIIESKIVRDHIKQREEEEKAGKVIVDPGAKMRKGGDSPTSVSVKRKQETGKPGGLMKWLSELQQKAEDMKRDTEKRKRDDQN